jgi:hypothetical protein
MAEVGGRDEPNDPVSLKITISGLVSFPIVEAFTPRPLPLYKTLAGYRQRAMVGGLLKLELESF